MKDIAIYGAGGFGREVLLLIQQINETEPQWNFLGFFDDYKSKSDKIQGFPILDSIEGLNAWQNHLYVIIAIADPKKRQVTSKSISNSKVHFPYLIHPSVKIDKNNHCSIGEGTIIAAQTVLTVNIEIGRHVIINLDCTIGHDVRIADYCSIMPGVNISGNVAVGVQSYIGTGASLIQNIKLGKETVIGAGAVVNQDIEDHVTAVGVPARKISSKN